MQRLGMPLIEPDTEATFDLLGPAAVAPVATVTLRGPGAADATLRATARAEGFHTLRVTAANLPTGEAAYYTATAVEAGEVLVVPGEAVNSDEGLWDFARNTGGTVFHCVGTCRMGSDDKSVLDPQLRVRGVERLPVRELQRCLLG